MVIEQLPSGLTIGEVGLGLLGGAPGSPTQAVSDGDTISVRAVRNLSVRLLGVDAPESRYPVPPSGSFVPLDDPEWEAFLSDPFAPGLDPFDPPLDPGLQEWISGRAGPDSAGNHARHAEVATRALEAEIAADLAALAETTEEFRFFLSYAHEVVDDFGRLLCYVNRFQSDPDRPQPRPPTYNERLLIDGLVAPYFIWPNVNPFREQPTLLEAVIAPGTASDVADADDALRNARGWSVGARVRRLGIYNREDPLRLLPFELRFLADREPPDRFVIDLSRSDTQLVGPQEYFLIPNPEDRLFIPAEYVPLFTDAGWQLPG